MTGEIVREPEAPEGFKRKEDGLYVPEGMDQSQPVSTSNEELLKVKGKLGPEEMASLMMHCYLNAVRTDENGAPLTDEKGVSYFTKKELSPEEAAKMVMERAAYHIHRKADFKGIDEDLYNQLKEIESDVTGNSYVTSVAEQQLGIEKSALEASLKNNGTGFNVMNSLVTKLTDQYLQQRVFSGVRNKLGRDPAQYKAGILDLQRVHHVASELSPEILDLMGLEELIKAYVSAILEATQKIKN